MVQLKIDRKDLKDKLFVAETNCTTALELAVETFNLEDLQVINNFIKGINKKLPFSFNFSLLSSLPFEGYNNYHPKVLEMKYDLSIIQKTRESLESPGIKHLTISDSILIGDKLIEIFIKYI